MPSPPPRRPKKPTWSRPLADLIAPTIDPVLRRQGFSESDLILNWDDIVGERLAANSRPIKLQWPARPAGVRADAAPQTATLVVRVEGGFALELQHMADQVLARINAHFGWRCVGRLAFKQGPIERAARARPARGALSGHARDIVAASVVGIEADGLRDALTRLGAHVVEAPSGVRARD